MLRNYLRIAVRHLTRHGLYVGVNVLGLGVALACCIIAFLNFRFDRSFDRFHEEADRIYRVATYKESNGRLYGISPMPIAEEARQNMPGIEAAVNYYNWSAVIKRGENVFSHYIQFVDGPFLEVFDFPLVAGDAGALSDPGNALISEEMATTYFGDADPIGQELVIYADKEYQRVLTVRGVLKDAPLNSSIRFSILTHFDNLLLDGEPVQRNDWQRFTRLTFLKLRAGASVEAVDAALQTYVPVWNQGHEDWTISRFLLEPFLDSAHNGHEVASNYLWTSFPPAAVWGPNILALLILLTACLNFTNTTVSLSDRRLKEMGVRKVLGGTQGQLVGQLLGESLLICLLAVGAAIVFVDWLLPPYNAMWPYLELEADYLRNPPLLLFIGALLLGTLLLAGSYPAFYLSSFRPANIFSSKIRFSGGNLFTRLLLGMQVVISLVAVIGGLAFAKNAQYQEAADLGYDRRGLLVVPIEGDEDYQKLRNALAENPDILGLAPTDGHVGFRLYSQDFESRGTHYESLRLDVGDHYLDVMGMELVAGRPFRSGPEADRRSVVVNELLAYNLGWEEPLGRQLTIDSTTYTVTGVVGDFIENDFFSPQSPILLLKSPPERYRYLLARTDPARLPAVREAVAATWRALFPFRPFDAEPQEEVLSEAVNVSSNIKVIFLFLAVITIILSSIGLFALVSLNILKRLKEIAIRRIIGASMRDIAYLVNRNYLWIFLAAILLGCAGGAFFAQKLLSSIFAIHVELGAALFLLSALAVLLIAALTVGWRLIGVLRVNPAEILRSE